MVRQIQQSEFTETINRGITTIVKFEADWCGPCKAIKPAVELLSDEWSDKEVEFVSLDVDGAANIATLHSVVSVPTFIAFRNGQPVSEVRAQINEPNIRKTFEKHL
jgi:thioredoxin 1